MADYGMVAFRAAVVDGFAFVCLDDRAPDFDDWLGDISRRHAPLGPDAVRGNYTAQFGTTQGTGGLTKDAQDQALPTIASLEGRNPQGTRYS